MASLPVVAVLSMVMLPLWQVAESSYDPIYGRSSSVFYNASTESHRYPDIQHIVESNYEYFLSDLNFDAISNRILCGAADKLYVLDYDLGEVETYSWEPVQSKKTSCDNSNEDTQSYTCRNHIRIYKKIPTLPDTSLLVCGTQATETPQCRVVQVSNGGSTLLPFSTADASPGIVSYYPGFSQLGEFRQQDDTDMTYISAGFFQGDNGVGRHFSISYQNISAAAPSTLTTAERFSTIEGDSNWLRFPVTFVDLLRLDYDPVAPADHDYEYQFYFVFLRENAYSATTSSDDLIQSRVARICRNDRGLTPADPDINPYFNSYMKARIFCQRQLDTGDEFDGAINYLYNELRSIAFTMGGRYYDSGAYSKMLYGAFTTPINGPRGTAICAYSAENSAEHGGNGLTQSMFDIFRADLVTPDGGQAENSLVECLSEGRSEAESQNILVHDKQVKQLGNDPLLVLDGVLISQMALDQQCVVKRDDTSSCLNQDILFLGTDSGKILKVVFANRGSGTVFPVVTEEISLDDNNNIEKMTIREVGGNKLLFVNTYSKLYRFPLERCSRHESCLDCIGSRDPYCVWDTNQNECVSNPFEVTGSGDQTVDSSRYKQDIHRGEEEDVTGCSSEPDCTLITSAPVYSSLQLDISCTNTQSNEVSVTVPNGLTAGDTTLTLDSNGQASTTVTGTIGFHSYTISVTVDGTTFTSTVTTPPGPPSTPSASEIMVDSITATSLRITLNIDSFTDYFTEYQFRVSGIGPTTSYQHLTTSNSITITNLSPATNYSYTIEVQNSEASTTSNEYSVTTLDDVPTAVQNLVATAPTDTSITLQWSQPQTTNGAITGYSITTVGGSEVIGCARYPDSTVTSYEVTGLVPFTEYRYSVSACTSAGEGPAEITMATTLCGAPGPVTDLRFPRESIMASSMVYTWSQPAVVNGDTNELEYNAYSVCYDDSGPVTQNTTSSSTQRTVDNLSPLTHCCVTVTPINRCQGQDATRGLIAELCAQTSDIVPGQVRNLAVRGTSHESLLVTWEPPENYQRVGLTYSISILSFDFSRTYTTYDETFVYVDGLESSTEFTVSVAAISGEGTGASQTATNSTLPTAPPSPSNPQLEVVNEDAVTLRLSWDFPEANVYQITGYETVMRCNEQEFPLQEIIGTSVDFDVSDPGNEFAWCTAQVRAVSPVGKSPFSALAHIAVPSQRPSTPRCFLVDDRGSSITISFDVTHPFSLDALEIRYLLLDDDQTLIRNETESFNTLSSNVLDISVSRNTKYDFQLRICNSHGCSEYCQQLRNFTTSSTAPRPPSSITVSDVTHNSASFSWETPAFEDANNITYTIQVSGTGVGSELLTLPGNQTTTDYFQGRLDPQTMYTVAIQVTDVRTGAMGVFGGVASFETLIGTPSEPRNLDVKWDGLDNVLSATWAVPNYTNGTLTRYEVRYSGSTVEDCDKQEVEVRNVTLGVDSREFTTANTQIIIDSKSVLVCVRAYTDKPGMWASSLLRDINIGGLGDDQESEEANCNGLIAVAVVAGLAVISTLVAGIVLCVVVRRSNQVMDDTEKTEEAGISDCPSSPSRFKSDNNFSRSASQYSTGDSNPAYDGSRTSPAPSPSEQSCDTGIGGLGLSSSQRHPAYASTPSIDSTRSTGSTAPLIGHNGSSR